MPGTWAHLLGTIGDAVQFGPTPFYTFTVRSTHARFQIQRMGRLTGYLVHRTVAFRDPPINADALGQMQSGRQLRHSRLKLQLELASDVI